jgi:hypothetical protein
MQPSPWFLFFVGNKTCFITKYTLCAEHFFLLHKYYMIISYNKDVSLYGMPGVVRGRGSTMGACGGKLGSCKHSEKASKAEGK